MKRSGRRHLSKLPDDAGAPAGEFRWSAYSPGGMIERLQAASVALARKKSARRERRQRDT
jgi:hypothetical protein